MVRSAAACEQHEQSDNDPHADRDGDGDEFCDELFLGHFTLLSVALDESYPGNSRKSILLTIRSFYDEVNAGHSTRSIRDGLEKDRQAGAD
jgi:hypothetical protein